METSPTSESKLTLKDLVLKIREVITLIKENKRKLLYFSLIPGIIFFFAVLTIKPKYVGNTTMIVDQSAGFSISKNPLHKLQSQILGMGQGFLEEDQIMEVMVSRKVVSNALLKKVIVGGKMDFLGNHLRVIYKFNEQWEGDTTLDNSEIRSDNLEAFTLHQNKSVSILHSFLTKKIISIGKSEKNKLHLLSVKTKNQELTAKLSEALLKSLVVFFEGMRIEKESKTVKVMENKEDSVFNALKKAEYNLAVWKDENSNRLIKAQGYLEELELMREVEILNVLYGEVVKNLEFARFSLSQKQQLIKVVDYPILPIRPAHPGYLIPTIAGIFIGFFLGVTYLYLFPILRKLLL
ncbi:MAG: hypothetical protein A3H98_00990 [Bacteroidetes bacterium RIFCSPLOWO2_02_FULL_36_8]|nr:MAG: hypothetical protein A3H98_00990 [Bacteroidetes bacterium RIFCSPLOWO2_02_FULL_36_8]OFY71020.1 MAG: hypothetical protein A3G23_12975 [Bacteroidetes bacterium RIFCSPLOWO2_12_FULL_37_12]